MAADLHIHILEGLTETDLFDFHNRKRNDETSYDKIANSPSIWIGEVSWLKAMFLGTDDFVPDVVGKISDLIGNEYAVLTDELISQIGEAFGSENKTSYDVADKAKVIEFLEQYKGEKVFTISW